MGRIYEALRRSNVEVDPEMRAAAPATPSPWLFEEHELHDAAEPAASDVELLEAMPIVRAVPTKTQPPAQRDEFDADATKRLVVSPTAGPMVIEQFRSLAATLHQAQREKLLKSVMVTSACPGDGKSQVAVNLALTLSHSYRRRVLLIDADLRRPSLHLMLGVPNTRGLSEALKTGTDESLASVRIGETLTLLPAGRPDADPLGGLSSESMKRIVADAAGRFDWVLVDAPPVGVVADGRLVSETVDTAILVIRAGVTRFQDVNAAAETLGRDRILGVVLNAVDPAEIRGEEHYHHYYGVRGDRR